MSVFNENILSKANVDLLKVGSCIEFDISFNSILENLNDLENKIDNYKNISNDFPNFVFDKKIEALRCDVSFLEELLFNFVDPKENYCKYLYKYND